MNRTFIISAERSNQPVMEVRYDHAGDALSSFISALAGAGHNNRAVTEFTRRWAEALMTGRDGLTVMDPGFGGNVSIHIRTK